MNENRTLKKALKIIIITAVILFVLPAILLRSCYYILRDPVKVTEKYLDYQSYDTHLVALKRTEEIGRYNYKSGYSRIRDCHWRYRQVVGESVDIMVYLHNGKTVNPQHYVLQNPKY